MKNEKIAIGISHMIRGMQAAGFGHDEIMAMREAMIKRSFRKIDFIEDAFFTRSDEPKTAYRTYSL